MEILSGFILGLMGSFHCIGMCGPLVLALPSGSHFILARALYNTGRVIVYGLFGLILGYLGARLNLAGLQQIVSITLGTVLVIAALAPEKQKYHLLKLLGLEKFVSVIRKNISAFYRSNALTGNLYIGALNGLLPCGFVYIALTGALVLGSAVDSSLFMVFFGFGTMPALLALGAAHKLISLKARNRMKRYTPAFALLIAALILLRGLNLGIPYLSPKLQNPAPASVNFDCH